MQKLRLIIAIAALALPLGALPVGAQDEPASSVVKGSIVLPEGSILPDDASVIVSVDDTILADAPAVMLSRLVMEAPGAVSPIPFALTVLPGVERAVDLGDDRLEVGAKCDDPGMTLAESRQEFLLKAFEANVLLQEDGDTR